MLAVSVRCAQQVEDVSRVHADAQAAADASAADLVAHKAHEVETRDSLERELKEWVDEQDEVENSPQQRELLANQRAHIERIRQRAEAARDATKKRNQDLLDELAAHLRTDSNK